MSTDADSRITRDRIERTGDGDERANRADVLDVFGPVGHDERY